VTYFGESDYEREKRWLEYETDKEQSDEYQKGLKNDLDIILRQIEESEGHNDSEDMSALLGRKKKKKSDKDEDLLDPFPDAALLENVCHEDVVLLTLKVPIIAKISY
jgi:hypothetical protein